MPVEEHTKHPHSPYLFVSPKTGTMFDPDSFRHTHEKILKAIGAEHIRFHDLRHPYVKHTTKNKSLQKQKSQTTNDGLVVWDFYFCISKLHTKIKKYQSETGISATMLIRILFLQFNRRCC